MANLARCAAHGPYMSPECPYCKINKEARRVEIKRVEPPKPTYGPGEMMDPTGWVAPEDYGD